MSSWSVPKSPYTPTELTSSCHHHQFHTQSRLRVVHAIIYARSFWLLRVTHTCLHKGCYWKDEVNQREPSQDHSSSHWTSHTSSIFLPTPIQLCHFMHRDCSHCAWLEMTTGRYLVCGGAAIPAKQLVTTPKSSSLTSLYNHTTLTLSHLHQEQFTYQDVLAR